MKLRQLWRVYYTGEFFKKIIAYYSIPGMILTIHYILKLKSIKVNLICFSDLFLKLILIKPQREIQCWSRGLRMAFILNLNHDSENCI